MIKCPVCYGRGTVPVGFYNKFESTLNCTEPTCKTCSGTGIVSEYRPQPDDKCVELNNGSKIHFGKTDEKLKSSQPLTDSEIEARIKASRQQAIQEVRDWVKKNSYPDGTNAEDGGWFIEFNYDEILDKLSDMELSTDGVVTPEEV